MNGPLSRVLTAVESGATTVAEVASSTGLDPGVVEAAVEHLRRTGRLAQSVSACPSSGCGGCRVRCALPWAGRPRADR